MKDTITAKITISADFETIQVIRKALANGTSAADLTALITSTVETQLHNHTSDFEVNTALKVSRYSDMKSGPRLPLPLLENDVLSWYDPDADRINKVGRVGDEYFIAFLNKTTRSFRYVSKDKATFTAMKRRDGIWYATSVWAAN